jgi:Ca-activated chloride channel family protein
LFISHRQRIQIALIGQTLKPNFSAWLRLLPDFFFGLVIAMLIIAIARPQKTNEVAEQSSEGIDICLVIDISESMRIEDFTPNRLEAAKVVAKKFIEGRKQDRIGLVVFAGEAYSLCPLTTDYTMVKDYLMSINFNMIQSPNTAIGTALGTSINRLRESPAKSKVVVLISDGANSGGNIDPQTAAQLAKAFGIRIYTIGVGRDGSVPFGLDAFGKMQFVENTMDESTLKQLAAIGQGKYFRAGNQKDLEATFEQINILEKIEIKVNHFSFVADFYQVYLLWGILFFICWLLLKATFMSNPLED